jgi:hypothetical protein
MSVSKQQIKTNVQALNIIKKYNIQNKIMKMQTDKNSSASLAKPFCKVCFDAGKSEEEYSSHWVKDKERKVVCPYLLSLNCRYCSKQGHTSKFCELLLKKENEVVVNYSERLNKIRETLEKEKEMKEKEKVMKEKEKVMKERGRFCLLSIDDEDDEEEEEEQHEKE